MTLHIAHLTAGYGHRPVLRDLSLTVAEGEILALVGPNGAGKTTLLRVISGALAPQAGHIRWKEHDLTTLRPSARARLVAVVPQARQLPPAFTVRQAVALGRTPYLSWLGKPGEHDRAAVQRALAQTDLLPLADRLLAHLSGGEQQRVLLARALAQETPLLLLDEPTTYLDLHHQAAFLRLVTRLGREEGKTVLMVLHDLNLAARFAHRVALLAEGHIAAIGTPTEVLTPQHLQAVYHTQVEVLSLDRRPVILIPPGV